jgi:hypothetical protein
MGEEFVSDARMRGKGPVADNNFVGIYSSTVTCNPSKEQWMMGTRVSGKM